METQIIHLMKKRGDITTTKPTNIKRMKGENHGQL